jgi:Zn-dependent M28 family amino/carboxypeptidase
MLNFALALIPAAVAAATAPVSIPPSWSAREKAAAAIVDERLLRAHVRFLSDDLTEGRAPASRGEQLAMRYVAAQMERIGLEPAGDGGGWLQRFDIVEMKNSVIAPPTVRAGKNSLTLRPGEDSIVGAGWQKGAADLKDAPLLFVGYGISAPEQKWDDFKGADLHGKVLVVMNNDPEDDPSLFGGKARTYYGRWSYKFEEAARRGAAGVLIIHTTDSAGYPWQVVQSSWGRPQFELPQGDEPRIAVKMWATDETAKKIVAMGGGQDLDELRKRASRRDFKPVPLAATISLSLKTEVRRLQTANVLGKLPGSDGKLSGEAVMVTAHHDHLGVGIPKAGDAIYNGALDNASGVAAMLTLAEAAASQKAHPKRSIYFASVGVEESGLLGSQWLCAHPPIAAGKIAADLNIDGINIWGRARDVTFPGLGKSSLDEVVKKAAREQGRSVSPDQFPERGHFYRSDQFSFARIGVPGVYFGAGTEFIGHPIGWGKERVDEFTKLHYHQPSDEITSAWDLAGAIDDLRLMLTVAYRVADAPSLPTWNAGDEFEAARKAALAGSPAK